MGYIYKITNKITNKCYIGETKKSNPYLRWNEHKSKIEKGIGCPALQYAVKKYGIDNFKFDILIICFDEDRYKFEKEYIKKYNSISPNGYNLTSGGEGGGFYGKKHTIETINKISYSLKQKYEDNPYLRKELSERTKLIFKDESVRLKIKEGMEKSEKWKNVKKKIFKSRRHTEETKQILKFQTSNYFNNDENKVKHREIMAVSKGIRILQYDLNNNFIKEFASISEASRQTGVAKSSIGTAIIKNTFKAGKFIWKKLT